MICAGCGQSFSAFNTAEYMSHKCGSHYRTEIDKINNSENYKNHPVSLGEIKSEKSHDSEHWTPRECLIHMLREIDNGFNPETLVICLTYKKKGDMKSRFRFSQSSKDGLHSVGLLEHVKVMMITDIESNDNS